AKLGFTRIQIAKERGGLGMSFFAKLRVAEELSRACMGFAFAVVNLHNSAQRIARDGKTEHIERYLRPLMRGERVGGSGLTEPGAGSDFAAIKPSARKVAGGWRLDGEK